MLPIMVCYSSRYLCISTLPYCIITKLKVLIFKPYRSDKKDASPSCRIPILGTGYVPRHMDGPVLTHGMIPHISGLVGRSVEIWILKLVCNIEGILSVNVSKSATILLTLYLDGIGTECSTDIRDSNFSWLIGYLTQLEWDGFYLTRLKSKAGMGSRKNARRGFGSDTGNCMPSTKPNLI